MNISDPIADMLTRIRNASKARHTEVVVPASRTKREIARILLEEGFIGEVREERDGPRAILRVTLKYVDGKAPVVSGLKRISKPGLRVYARKTEIPRGFRRDDVARHQIHVRETLFDGARHLDTQFRVAVRCGARRRRPYSHRCAHQRAGWRGAPRDP